MKLARIASVLAAFLALSSSTPSFSEEDSTGRPGWVRRKIDALLSDVTPGTGRGRSFGPFTPGVAILSSGAGPAPILHLWAPNLVGTPLDIHASAAYSLYKYSYFDLRVGLVPHVGDRIPRVERGTGALFPLTDIEKTATAPSFSAYVSARYRDYPREDFSGMGPQTFKANRTDFRLRDGLYEGIVRQRFGRLSVMGRAGLLQTSILPGRDSSFPNTEEAYDERTAQGLVSAPDFLHLSAGGWLERRDEPLNPHRGMALGVSVSRFDERKGNTFQWNRLIVDAREYIPLGSKRHILALRQATSIDRPDAGSTVPFYLQSTLGGSRLLRGYGSSRFHDLKLLYLAGEYRFEVRPKVELALLYDTGKVFSASEDFNLKNLRRSYGAGIRLKSPRKVHFRLDVLRSLEGTRVHVKLEPSF